MGLEPKRRDDLLCGGHVSLSSPVSARRQPDGMAELAIKTASLPARQPAWQFLLRTMRELWRRGHAALTRLDNDESDHRQEKKAAKLDR